MERWDFGDGSPAVETKSNGAPLPHAPDGYAITTHRFAKPGMYVVTVTRENEAGDRGFAHLAVEVDP
jgi:hypothetical protein